MSSRESPSSRARFNRYVEAAKNRPIERNTPDRPTVKLGVRDRSFGVLVRSFFHLMEGQRLALAFALATLTISTLLKLIPPAATKLAIDNVLGAQPLPPALANVLPPSIEPKALLFALAAAVIAISLVETTIQIVGRWQATRAAKRILLNIRRRAFEHASQLPLHRIYQIKSGGVASLLREDTGGISELVFSMIYNPWRAIVQLVGSLIILACVDARLLIGAFAIVPPIVWTHRTWIARIRPAYRDIRKQRQEIDGHATEAFGGMRVVRAFGRRRSETSRFTTNNDLLARQELRAWWWTRGVELFWEILMPIASAALLGYGGLQVLNGSLTLGELMMFLFYLAMLLGPLATLAASVTEFQTSLAALDRVLDLMAEPTEMPAAEGARTLQPREVEGHVRLDAVRFRYPNSNEDVLRDIDLDVPAGTTVALVGASGAGKTTLCNLVARFYDPTEGTVKIDGVDLRDIRVDSFRKLLGVVEQDIFLFDGTIADNIAYGRKGASMEDVRRAAEAAHADEFIDSFEDAYDTVIGERGVRLSGGQRQRLAIARAILADPRVLILDEATSNLDTHSERLIQKSLRTLMRSRTCFVIAHRLSTIQHADLILVMDHGRIIERGSHGALMSRSSRYREMVRSQMSAELLDDSLAESASAT